MPPYQPVPFTPEQIEVIRRKNKQKLVWGLVCLLGPTALLIATILLYAIVNLMVSGISDGTGSPAINVLLFLVGTITIVTWLPGIIIGIILLATRQKVQ